MPLRIAHASRLAVPERRHYCRPYQACPSVPPSVAQLLRPVPHPAHRIAVPAHHRHLLSTLQQVQTLRPHSHPAGPLRPLPLRKAMRQPAPCQWRRRSPALFGQKSHNSMTSYILSKKPMGQCICPWLKGSHLRRRYHVRNCSADHDPGSSMNKPDGFLVEMKSDYAQATPH